MKDSNSKDLRDASSEQLAGLLKELLDPDEPITEEHLEESSPLPSTGSDSSRPIESTDE